MTIKYVQGRILPDSSRDATEQSSRTHLKGAIQEFLTESSSNPSQPGICPRCGRTMQHLNATFSFYGSDSQWNIPLPVCPCSMSVELTDQSAAENVLSPRRRSVLGHS